MYLVITEKNASALFSNLAQGIKQVEITLNRQCKPQKIAKVFYILKCQSILFNFRIFTHKIYSTVSLAQLLTILKLFFLE